VLELRGLSALGARGHPQSYRISYNVTFFHNPNEHPFSLFSPFFSASAIIVAFISDLPALRSFCDVSDFLAFSLHLFSPLAALLSRPAVFR